MTEKHIPRPEQNSSQPEQLVSNEHLEHVQRVAAERAERASAEKSAENIDIIRQLAEQEARQADTIKHEQPVPESRDESLIGMQSSLKSAAYVRTLGKIQQKLPKPVRAFSRLSHNPVVDKISAASSKTVARPSGLLGGSICAFLGSLIVFYYSKHYGFRYNYLLLFILFLGGFLIGATLEFLIWIVYKRSRQDT